MDIEDAYLPAIGTPDIFGPSAARAADWAWARGMKPTDHMAIHRELYVNEATRVAKFLGLVARTHNYINRVEEQANYPGCRTIVATGLRQPLLDRHGDDE